MFDWKTQHCIHPECIYRASPSESSLKHNCDYAGITGECRTVGVSEEDKLPCNCKKYVPGGEPARTVIRRGLWRDEAWGVYRSGATDQEIAEAMGVSRNAVRKWRYDNNLPCHQGKAGPPAGDYDWEKAMEAFEAGATDREIAAVIGVKSVTPVRHWRERNNLVQNTDTIGRRKKG